MASHYVNAALHATERVRQDRDIKHNRLEGFVQTPTRDLNRIRLHLPPVPQHHA